ncbi:hypothetical protein F4781DRAFT_409590 [Annulohypoxylon bovei var. microspora]|nr:hypothetical protein F4781DRAFT_409590 [Annulohypoxylon bovei var. microspora]
MKTSSIFTSAFFWATTIARTFQTSGGLPSGYVISNLTWTGNITDNGPQKSFTGSSFWDIEAQIRDVNPGFSWPDPGNDDLASLMKSEASLTCDPNNIWWADAFRIKEGIEYLSGRTGKCHIGAGPRVCTRISCSYKSAIWWCNDNSEPVEENCMLWSHYAQHILDSCQTNDASVKVRGQQFSTSNWNVMVGFDDDHC